MTRSLGTSLRKIVSSLPNSILIRIYG
jgi:hypothetical protein